jgi:nucleotidyltransferase substrate binding protein (TIGR01987 family)
MTEIQDTRWVQRFNNFLKAIQSLRSAQNLALQRPLSELEKQGFIQSFEFCHELAWNTLKDLLEHQGISGMLGSRDVVRESFARGIIRQGDDWMDMIKSRNLSSHTYNQNITEDIVSKIRSTYILRFEELITKLESIPK